MRDSFLPFSPPTLGDEEIDEVVDTLRSGWISTGPKVARFEQDFADVVGAESALAVSSCTAALHLALCVLGVGPGDSVITTPMTFCSTIHAIEHLGARPVFVDIERETLNLDPKLVEARLGEIDLPRPPVAVLPIHYGGHPYDVDSVVALAAEHDLAVVEDGAHALGSEYKGRAVGMPLPGVRSAACFSFYATKNVTTGEGGMLTAARAVLDEARIWSLHGMSRDAWQRYQGNGSWYYEVDRPGFKYNMTDIQAALGIHQLRRLREMQDRRLAIATRYTEALAALDCFEVPRERPGCTSAWHLYPLRLHLDTLTIDRNRFIEAMAVRQIGASVHFIPLHIQPYYRDRYGYAPTDFPVAYEEFQRLISLPIYPRMTDDDVDDVIEAVGDIARQHRR
jgi:dTDP-4-amino-4,6-dideoxygalactose transaminase